MYKILLKPLWTYGIRLWGTAKVSNTKKIKRFQNITLREITNKKSCVNFFYKRQKDLSMKIASKEAVHFYERSHDRFQSYHNPLIKSL